MNIAVKVSNLRAKVKDLRSIDKLPKSTLDLVLMGIEAELSDIQQDINRINEGFKDVQTNPTTVAAPVHKKVEKTPIGSGKDRVYGQPKDKD